MCKLGGCRGRGDEETWMSSTAADDLDGVRAERDVFVLLLHPLRGTHVLPQLYKFWSRKCLGVVRGVVPGSHMCEWVWGMGKQAEGQSEQSSPHTHAHTLPRSLSLPPHVSLTTQATSKCRARTR